jgi:CRISPR-associated protein Csh2
METMKNNVYGLLGIGVRNSMWNAGFDKLPKRDGQDIIKGSSYALQFCIKNQWYNKGERVLGIKTFQANGDCSDINQRYFDLFNEEDVTEPKKDKKESDEQYNLRKQTRIERTRNNIVGCKDVLNFGIAYTGANSMSIRGIVQLADGINKYEDTNIVEEQILSPYSNSNKEDTTMSTLGTKYTTDEAHYVYDFSVFPTEYNKYINSEFKGYTKDDYEDFKKTSLIAVSNYNSKAKSGCKNEFAMFIKVKENQNYLLDLNCLQDYVQVYKEDKIVYDLTLLEDLLLKLTDKIEDIEMYYNIRTIKVKGEFESLNIRKFDLITMEEI